MMSTLLVHMWSNPIAKRSHPSKGTCLDHVWLKPAVWQSPPMRGTFWATFGWSPLCDKVLQWGAHFGPHLVKVQCMTKSSNEGHILGHIWSKSAAWKSPLMRGTYRATFGQSPQWDKVLRQGALLFFCHIWQLSAAWQLSPLANHGHHFPATLDQSLLCDTISFYARFGQCPSIDTHLSSQEGIVELEK